MAAQQDKSAMSRHGSRCADKNSAPAARNRNRKMVDDNGSLEKLVGGVMYLTRRSWISAKSAMQFCRSRMLRKKSFDISPAGLIVRGGAKGGPVRENPEVWLGGGGGGCRAR